MTTNIGREEQLQEAAVAVNEQLAEDPISPEVLANLYVDFQFHFQGVGLKYVQNPLSGEIMDPATNYLWKGWVASWKFYRKEEDTRVEDEQYAEFIPDGMVINQSGEVIEIEEFESLKKARAITPDDGTGYWATVKRHHPHLDVYAFNKPIWATHVAWFSK